MTAPTKKQPFIIGDHVTTSAGVKFFDGTVVDVIDPDSEPPLVRVYWRLAMGRAGKNGVKDYYASHLQRVV